MPKIAQPALIRPKMPELDSLRGLAILAVTFYHGFFWSQGVTGLGAVARWFVLATLPGWLGVNLFFVLSGFLITGILCDTRGRRDYYARFYFRRAVRILPAYYALLILLELLQPRAWKFWALSTAYLSNFAPLFGIAVAYPVLWSLAVEEQFYLLWPAVVRRLPANGVLSCACVTIIATPFVRWIEFRHGRMEGLSFYTWNVADALATGAALSILLRTLEKDRKWLTRFFLAIMLLSALLEAGGARFGILTKLRPIGAALQVTPWNLTFAAVLGIALIVGTSDWKSLVLSPVLRFFGEISYGLYLIHLLIFQTYDRLSGKRFPDLPNIVGHFAAMWIRFGCVMIVAVGLSYLSRRYFEGYFLGFKDRRINSNSSLGAQEPRGSGLAKN